MKSAAKPLFIASLSILVFANAALAGWSEPVPVPGINTLATDYYPSISSDGSKMYFVSTRSHNEDIYVTTRTDSGWSTPVNLGPPINTGERDLAPSISADGRTLYFVTWNRPGGLGSYDIWYATWNDSSQNWNDPINPGPNINSPGTEWSPSISHDGTKLYYALADPFRPDWQGGLDLYVSEKDSLGNWQPPANLGRTINTSEDDYCCSMAADDTTIYFASWHHHNLPCWHGPAVDLFVAYYSDGHWGNVANLCDPINTEYWERCPSISSSGDTLYFARRRTTLDEFDDILYSVREPIGVNDDSDESPLPRELEISISPNPFNSSTLISISTRLSGTGQIAIANVSGQILRQYSLFIPGRVASITWDGADSGGVAAASGIYFVTARIGRAARTVKLIKLK